MNEIISLEPLNARANFTHTQVEDAVAQVSDHLQTIEVDTSTEAGRKQIASVAHKVAKIKTGVDKIGKSLGDDLREELSKINEVRKRGVRELQELQDDFRRPLTDYEIRQEERKKEFEAWIEKAQNLVPLINQSWDMEALENVKKEFEPLLEMNFHEYTETFNAIYEDFKGKYSLQYKYIKEVQKQKEELKALRREKEEMEKQRAEIEAEKQRLAELSKPAQQTPTEPEPQPEPQKEPAQEAQKEQHVPEQSTNVEQSHDEAYRECVDAVAALGCPEDFANKLVSNILVMKIPHLKFEV